MKSHYSTQELANMKLEGWPTTRQAFEYRAKNEGWSFTEVKASGGRGGLRREYAIPTLLAQSIKAQLIKQSFEQLPVHVNVVSQQVSVIEVQPQNINHLADWQRDCAIARFGLVQIIERDSALVGKTNAINNIVIGSDAGTLPADVMDRVRLANAKAGDRRGVSQRSLFDWCTAATEATKRGINPISVLAPKMRAQKIPSWAAQLLKLWGQPQKPNLTTVIEQLPNHLPVGVDCPSYSQCRRFLIEQMGSVEREKGRMGARQLKNIKPFVRRDTAELLPTDIYTMDGHCFDAEVAHPDHGRPFRPEITAVIDVATRMCVGWSIDLAESGWAVLDAIRNACERWGIAASLYVDNGSGYENELMKAQGRGLMDQLSMTMTNSLPYNSQARGIIERSHQTIWIKAAKKLPTYMGADMDQEAKHKAFKVTRADVKAFGRSKILMDFPTFRDFCTAEAGAYNHKPHRGLAKIRDEVTGKLRHLSPVEAWDLAVKAGFEATPVDPDDADGLFRPYVVRAIRRGEVELFSNRYFSRDLEQYHGQTMAIGYDIHDPEHIWVHDDDGRLVAKAVWNGNKTNYFPKAVVETNRETRAKGRLRRLAVKQAEVMEELSPNQVLEHIQGQSIPLPSNSISKSLAALNEMGAENDLIEANERVVQMPRIAKMVSPLSVVPDSEESKLARWCRLDDEWLTYRKELKDVDDANFHRLFQRSKAFVACLEKDDALRLRMESSAEMRKLIEETLELKR